MFLCALKGCVEGNIIAVTFVMSIIVIIITASYIKTRETYEELVVEPKK
jgi:hypothetical protein